MKDKIKTPYKVKRNLSKVNPCLILSTAYLDRVSNITRNANQEKKAETLRNCLPQQARHTTDRSNRTREGDKNANEDHTASLLNFPPLLSGHPEPVY